MTDPDAILLVGAGGLVGRHVEAAARSRGTAVHRLSVPWDDEEGSAAALTEGISAFVAGVGTRPWALVWAAGAGVVATGAEALAVEQRVFTRAMAALCSAVTATGASTSGGLVLVSSAGGVYAGSQAPPFTEASPPRPVSTYGEVKLAMETVAREHCTASDVPLLIVRPSNVYGPGQRLGKASGLISQICLAHATGEPLPVMVSLDTLRDYVYAPDLAQLVCAGTARLVAERPGETVIKIVAQGASVTVGQVLSEARRVLRRPVRSVLVAGRGAGQVADLRFRSVVWRDLDAALATGLPVGLSATASDVLTRLAGVGRTGDLDASSGLEGRHEH